LPTILTTSVVDNLVIRINKTCEKYLATRWQICVHTYLLFC